MPRAFRLAAAPAVVLLLSAVLGGGAGASSRALPAQLGILRIAGTTQARQGGDGTPLTYHGGPVMRANTTYPILWSPPGYEMPADYQAAIAKYFQDVAAGSGGPATSYAVAQQYFDNSGPVTVSSTFGEPIVLTDPVPANACNVTPAPGVDVEVKTCVVQHTILALVEHAAALKGLAGPSLTATFFVFTPPGVADCSERGTSCSYRDFAAYHSSTQSGLLFSVHPWFGATPQLNGVSHEHIEMLTDPLASAWYTDGPSQGEVADLCQKDAEVTQTMGSGTYSLPQEWSNAAGGCSAQAPPPSTRLTLGRTGPGVGEVTATFAGLKLSCGTGKEDESCRTVLKQGARVTLVATPHDGFSFSTWDRATPCAKRTSATCTFTAPAAATKATASFGTDDASALFLISVDIRGKGTVTWPNGTKCRASCIKSFRGGTALALTATPAKGWHLKSFVDDTKSCRARARCTIHVRDNDDVRATFVRG
jgi:hypothetical protein